MGLLPGGVPQSRFAGGHSNGDTIVLRVDGTISLAHSGKQQAAGTFKGTYGFHPLGCWIDNTRELAVLLPRPGNAGANTTVDLIDVLKAAIAQVPSGRRDDLLVTSDGAGASHDLIGWLTGLNTAGRKVRYSIGFDVDAAVRAAANSIRDDRWLPCLSNTTGDADDQVQCVEITDRLRERLTALGWPADMRVIVRRRRLFDFEQPTLFDTNGYRYSAFATNTPPFGPDALSVQLLDARHRVHARVEDDVRTTKDTGLGRLPSKSWQVNTSWCAAVCIAVDLIAWLRLYALTGTALAKAEPKRCATASSASRPGWYMPAATAGCACPEPGPGPSTSPTPPTGSDACPCRLPDQPDHHRDNQEEPKETTTTDATVGTTTCPNTEPIHNRR